MPPKRRLSLVVATLAVAFFARSAFALEGGIIRDGGGRRHRERRPSRYYVYQLKGLDGNVTFEVVPDIEAFQWRKEIRDSYEEAVKDWITGYRLARKRGEKYAEPKPHKPVYRVVRSFRTEKDAQDYADKWQEKWDKMIEAKRAKEGGMDLGEIKGGKEEGQNKKAEKK